MVPVHAHDGDSSIPGFPHLLIEDDVHDGYYIPKGTLVMVNIWYVPSLSQGRVFVLTVSAMAGTSCTTRRHTQIP